MGVKGLHGRRGGGLVVLEQLALSGNTWSGRHGCGGVDSVVVAIAVAVVVVGSSCIRAVNVYTLT